MPWPRRVVHVVRCAAHRYIQISPNPSFGLQSVVFTFNQKRRNQAPDILPKTV